MRCKETEILLQLAADGEITDAEQNALDEHLDSCVACRRKEAWLELLEAQLTANMNMSTAARQDVADAVITALRPQRSLSLPPQQLISRNERQVKASGASKKTVPKKGLLPRMVSALWRRSKQSLSKKDVALLPAPTSLEKFRAAKQGVTSAVSGPVRAFKWVSGIWPRKGRS